MTTTTAKAMATATFLVYVITALGLTMTLATTANANAADSSSQPQKQQQQHHQHHRSRQSDTETHRLNPSSSHSSHRPHAAAAAAPPPPPAPLESCDAVKEAFVSRGIGAGHLVLTAPASGSGLKHCPSPRTCCREAMVRRYQNSIVQDYDSVVGHVVAPLKGLLHQSIADFEHHFDQLLQISLNKTNHLFQV